MITKDDLPKLKKFYLKAVSNKAESFMFKGNEMLTTYAKYVIELLET